MPEELPERIRSFVAIHVPSELLERILCVQRELQRVAKTEAVRWTPLEQMHVTLKFFGNVPNERLSALEIALAEAVIGSAPFSLSLEGFGCFPSARNPSVFWAGLVGQVEALKQLQARIEARTNCFASHEENREFHPHLTVGRAKNRGPESRRVADALEKFRLAKMGQWTVSEIALMRSKLSPKGAIHTQLAVVKLTRLKQ